MITDNIQLQGATYLNNMSLNQRFPIIGVVSENQRKENLLLYSFVQNGQPNYIVLGRLISGYLPRFDNQLLQSWLGHLSNVLSFGAVGNDIKAETDYLLEMGAVQNSPMASKIEWTQEGFDIISGKQHFLQDGILQRTVVMEMYQEDNEYFFGSHYSGINEKNNMKGNSLFAPYREYMNNYFLNQEDLIRMSYEQAKSFALFHRYRIVKHIKENRANEDWLISYCNEALSANLEDSGMAAVQLLDSIVEMQLGAKVLDSQKKH